MLAITAMVKAMKVLTSASLLFSGVFTHFATQAAAGVCQLETEDLTVRDHSLFQLGTPSTWVADASRLTSLEGRFESSSSVATVGKGEWCEIQVPSNAWTLKYCSKHLLEVKVLTYNLFWWNLFGSGRGSSAGKLIASAGQDKPYDFMGFQECQDAELVLRDASLAGQYGSIAAPHDLAIAYRKAAWELIDHGMHEVAEDNPQQWWGTRGAQWARFRHKSTGYALMFVNHHGALPVGSGGKCGLLGTAYNILHAITSHRQSGEGVVLVGDFNSNEGTEEIKELDRRLRRINTGTSFGGVDHIFTNCGGVHVVETRNLGNGGSDHDALDAVVRL